MLSAPPHQAQQAKRLLQNFSNIVILRVSDDIRIFLIFKKNLFLSHLIFVNSSSKLTSFTIINYLLLFGAGFIWGSQYILTKFALVSFSTTTIAAGRIGIGALLLTLLVTARVDRPSISKTPSSFWRSLPDFFVIGLLEATLPCILIAWAQLYLASSVAAVIIGTVPLFATVLEALFVAGSRISFKKG